MILFPVETKSKGCGMPSVHPRCVVLEIHERIVVRYRKVKGLAGGQIRNCPAHLWLTKPKRLRSKRVPSRVVEVASAELVHQSRRDSPVYSHRRGVVAR